MSNLGYFFYVFKVTNESEQLEEECLLFDVNFKSTKAFVLSP